MKWPVNLLSDIRDQGASSPTTAAVGYDAWNEYQMISSLNSFWPTKYNPAREECHGVSAAPTLRPPTVSHTGPHSPGLQSLTGWMFNVFFLPPSDSQVRPSSVMFIVYWWNKYFKPQFWNTPIFCGSTKVQIMSLHISLFEVVGVVID